jgi:hypothetical protein
MTLQKIKRLHLQEYLPKQTHLARTKSKLYSLNLQNQQKSNEQKFETYSKKAQFNNQTSTYSKNLFYVSNSDSSKNPQPQFHYRSNMGEHFLKNDANSQRFGNLNNFLNFFSNTSANISIVIHNNYEQVLTIFIFNWTLRSLN